MPTHLLQPRPQEPGQEFFFSTPELAQRLDFLRHLTENSDYVPLIKGGAGTGKTYMANRLQTLAGENWMLCRFEAKPELHPNELLAQCARCFGVKQSQSQGRLLEDLIHSLDDLRLAGRLPVILVDDAHALPPETLVFLFRLHAQPGGDFPLVRVVLFADPRIDDVLAAPQFESVDLQKLHTLEIPRLKAQQVAKFMKHALGDNEGVTNDSLSVDEVIRLHRTSGGVPGRLVELIEEEMSRRGVVKAGPRRRLPLKWLAGLAAMILLVSVVLMYQDDINRLFESQGSADQTLPIPDGDPVALPVEGPREVLQDARRPDSPGIQLFNPPSDEVPRAKARPGPPPPTKGPLPDQPPRISAPTDEAGQGKPAQTPPAPRPPERQGAVKKPPAAFETPPRSAPKPANVTPAKIPSGPARSPATPTDKGWRREAWLLAQNPQAYTMQLLGVREEATLAQFIERYGLQDKALYYESRGKGKQPWFSLLYGVYPDRKAAEAGRRKLPAALRKKDVWFRRLDAVQSEIRDSAR